MNERKFSPIIKLGMTKEGSFEEINVGENSFSLNKVDSDK